MNNTSPWKLSDFPPSDDLPPGPGQGHPDSKLAFPPESVFYDAGSGKYHIELATHFRTYGRKGPVVQGVARHYMLQGINEDEARKTARSEILDAEIDRACDWSGALAGHRRGIVRKNGQALLITSEPDLVDPAPGMSPTISNLIRQAFPDPEARTVFCLWLAAGFRAVRGGVHQPGPMMVLAGEVNSGKSFLGWLTKEILGGRQGSPGTAWTGSLVWNDDLAGSELLLLDDSVGSHDMRKRIEFGARFKESIYSNEVQIHRRHNSSISLRPVWRVMVCCNRTAEALSVIPPLDADLSDKVSLLSVAKIEMPVDTSDPEGRTELQGMIRAELPQFVHQILAMKIPDHLRDSRSGAGAWRDPELLALLDGIDESARFADLLLMAMKSGVLDLEPGESVELTAAEIEAKMTAMDSPVRDQARQILGRHHSVTGRILAKLAENGSNIVSKGKCPKNRQHWILTKPIPG